MKTIRNILTVVLIAVALILFVPVPKGSYDDGGTREYEALTYKIIRWNRLSPTGTYRKTCVYWGADKHLPIDDLFSREFVDHHNTKETPHLDSDSRDEYVTDQQEVVFENEFEQVILPIPDGWEYILLDDGIRFKPTGENGYLRLYYTDFFGVCGTALHAETIKLGKFDAEQATYDNHDLWNYILLPKEWYSVGDYVILNEGVDAWWNTHGDEAMDILSGITMYHKVIAEEKAVTFAKDVCTIEHDRHQHAEPFHCHLSNLRNITSEYFFGIA